MKHKFSEHGIKDKEVFQRIYSDFIDYCSRYATSGTFSTYTDGEPVFMVAGFEIAYSTFKQREVQEWELNGKTLHLV